jgi:membrane protein implicated in regulation of membrane protease activity
MRAARSKRERNRHRIPLVMRARFERTFFGLGLFAALSLFLCGAYLLTEAIRDPLEASESAVICAGFTLSLASFVLTYLVWPRAKSVLEKDQDSPRHRRNVHGAVLTVYGQTVHTRLEAKQLLAEGKNLRGPM